jgi:hypothetical protein
VTFGTTIALFYINNKKVMRLKMKKGIVTATEKFEFRVLAASDPSISEISKINKIN